MNIEDLRPGDIILVGDGVRHKGNGKKGKLKYYNGYKTPVKCLVLKKNQKGYTQIRVVEGERHWRWNPTCEFIHALGRTNFTLLSRGDKVVTNFKVGDAIRFNLEEWGLRDKPKHDGHVAIVTSVREFGSSLPNEQTQSVTLKDHVTTWSNTWLEPATDFRPGDWVRIIEADCSDNRKYIGTVQKIKSVSDICAYFEGIDAILLFSRLRHVGHQTFAVGDEVRVRTGRLEDSADIAWNSEMHQYQGQTFKIAEALVYNSYKLEGAGTWAFLEKWLEPVVLRNPCSEIVLSGDDQLPSTLKCDGGINIHEGEDALSYIPKEKLALRAEIAALESVVSLLKDNSAELVKIRELQDEEILRLKYELSLRPAAPVAPVSRVAEIATWLKTQAKKSWQNSWLRDDSAGYFNWLERIGIRTCLVCVLSLPGIVIWGGALLIVTWPTATQERINRETPVPAAADPKDCDWVNARQARAEGRRRWM